MTSLTTATDWVDWLDQNFDALEDTKLAVLREFIVKDATFRVRSGDISAEWANKKLVKLGITDRVDATYTYTLEVPVSGTVTLGVVASDRAAAVQRSQEQVTSAHSFTVTGVTALGNPTFVSGPEDSDPADIPDDAPTTVDATLSKFREIVMLGNVAGPRFDCETGVNRVLASYGLDLLPPRKTFTVSRPAAVEMVTTVTAYDEASAAQIAEWRWDNKQVGYTATNASAIDDASVSAAS